MSHLISVLGGFIGMIGAGLWLGGIAFLLNLIVAPNGLHRVFTWVPDNGWLRLALGLVAIWGGLRIMKLPNWLEMWAFERRNSRQRQGGS